MMAKNVTTTLPPFGSKQLVKSDKAVVDSPAIKYRSIRSRTDSGSKVTSCFVNSSDRRSTLHKRQQHLTQIHIGFAVLSHQFRFADRGHKDIPLNPRQLVEIFGGGFDLLKARRRRISSDLGSSSPQTPPAAATACEISDSPPTWPPSAKCSAASSSCSACISSI